MANTIHKERGLEVLDDGRILLILCPECHRENYAPNVNSGLCSWCGYDAHNDNRLQLRIKNHLNKS